MKDDRVKEYPEDIDDRLIVEVGDYFIVTKSGDLQIIAVIE